MTTGLVDLHVLRRIAVLGEDKPARATLPALIEDCDRVSRIESRICDMERELLVKRRQSKATEYFVVSPAGMIALDAEPTHYRESYGFTNR